MGVRRGTAAWAGLVTLATAGGVVACSSSSSSTVQPAGPDAADDASSDAGAQGTEGGDAGSQEASINRWGDAGPENSGGAFVQLFEWSWPDIAKECQNFLGPKGFAAVQVSPPSEHAILYAYPWYERYQTVGYGLDRSRSGTKAEFVNMVQTCAAAGVDIYVDAVINHTTAQTTGTGSNGTSFTKYQYPNLYMPTDFHQPTCQIMPSDYTSSATHIWTCELLGLADLDTGADHVRATLANYLISLIQVGVRGFRIDAAKHIAPPDLDAILSRVAAATTSYPAPYYYFEVQDPGGQSVSASDYYSVGSGAGLVPQITEFNYGSGVSDKFLGNSGQTLAQLKGLGPGVGWNLMPANRAVVFTNNHDTQRGTAIFYQNAPNYDLANVFMLAWPYGYPLIMSGYAFNRATTAGQAQGPVSDSSGNTLPIYPAGSNVPSCASSAATASPGTWTCEHRARSAANMVGFRLATAANSTVTDWWDDGSNQIAFGRGNLGFVVINAETAALTKTLTTELPPGTYCDVVGGDFTGTACTGSTVTIDGAGSFMATVPPGTAIAIHARARLK
jgi:alpha-amylase